MSFREVLGFRYWVLGSLISFNVFAQQDALVSQYMHLPVLFNPASVGAEDKIKAGLLFRRQWVGMNNAPSTNGFVVDMPFNYSRMGLGVNVLQESIVAENKLTFQLCYSYKINLAKGKMAFGMNAGAINYRFDDSKIAIKDADDKVIGNGALASTQPDFGFGFYYHSAKWQLGISANHLLKHKLGYFDELVANATVTRQVYGFAKRNFKLNEKYTVSTSVLAKIQQPVNVSQAEANAILVFKDELWLGAGYRTLKAATFQIGFKMGKVNQSLQDIRLSYNYDLALENPTSSFGPTHEIVLRAFFDKPLKPERIQNKPKAISPLDL